MPTVLIQVEMDDSGMVTGSKRIEDGLQKVGSKGNVVMTGLRKDTEHAHDAARLMGRTLGVELPRQLDKFLANSKLLGPMLARAFDVAIVAAFAQAIATVLVDAIKAAMEEYHKFEDLINRITEEQVKRSNARILENEEKNKGLRLANAMALASEIEKVQLKLEADLKRVHDEMEKAMTDADIHGGRLLQEQRVLLVEKAAKDITEIEQKRAVGIAQIEAETNAIGLKGLDAISQAWEDQTKLITLQLKARMITAEQFSAQQALIDRKARQATGEFFTKIENESLLGGLQGAASRATGILGIELKLEADLERIRQEELQTGVMLTGKWREAHENAAHAVEMVHRSAAMETRRVETEAALAVLPAWQRAYAQISATSSERLHEIEQRYEDHLISWEQMNQQMVAVGQIAGAQMRDQLASDLEQMVQNPMQFFLQRFKHMIFEMVASWLLGMGQMKGGLGGLLRGLFGMGGGSGFGITGAGGTAPFSLGSLFGLGRGGAGGGISIPGPIPLSRPSAGINVASHGGLFAALGGTAGVLTMGALGAISLYDFFSSRAEKRRAIRVEALNATAAEKTTFGQFSQHEMDALAATRQLEASFAGLSPEARFQTAREHVARLFEIGRIGKARRERAATISALQARFIPEFHSGGQMPYDGLAMLKRGEVVLDPSKGQRSIGDVGGRGGGGISVVINNYAGNGDEVARQVVKRLNRWAMDEGRPKVA